MEAEANPTASQLSVQQRPPFWVVWSPRGGGPRYRHTSFELAHKEADRLAKRLPNRHFYIMECSAFVMEGKESLTAKQAALTSSPVVN